MLKKQKRSRRSNNEGCVYKRKTDGLWCGYISIKDTRGKSKRKYIYAKTQKEVEEKLSGLTNRISSGCRVEYMNKSLGELMQEYMLVVKKNTVTSRTFENQFRNFKLHILPKIGHLKLQEIYPMTIQRLLSDCFEVDKLQSDCVNKIKFLLKGFFEYAIDNRLTNDNPALKVKVRSQDRGNYSECDKYKAIQPNERADFIKSLENHSFLYSLCTFLIFSGLRIGEALTLIWEDIDFDKKIITVLTSQTYKCDFNRNGEVTSREIIVSDTKKICHKRQICMSAALFRILSDIHQKQLEKDEKLVKKSSFVFGYENGELRTYNSVKKMFERFKKSHNINPSIHFHTLRHTCATMLLENATNPKVVQEVLGHSSVKTTLDIYNSINLVNLQESIDKMNPYFDNLIN